MSNPIPKKSTALMKWKSRYQHYISPCKRTNQLQCTCEYCIEHHVRGRLAENFGLFYYRTCPFTGNTDWYNCHCKLCELAAAFREKYMDEHGGGYRALWNEYGYYDDPKTVTLCKQSKTDWMVCTCRECTYHDDEPKADVKQEHN